jgi:hypothetical protein
MKDIRKAKKITDVAEQIRNACIGAAREGFQDALVRGLCSEGAMEAAISSMQNLKLEKIIHEKG